MNETCSLTQRICLFACWHTPNQSRVFQRWLGPAPAAELACGPPTCEAETGQAAPHQGKDAALAGGRSETETLGTDCALHCSDGKREQEHNTYIR